MITYEKQSLFDAPKGSIILHACNAKGIWGSGIAKEFFDRYPSSFIPYSMSCVKHSGATYAMPGESGIAIPYMGYSGKTSEHIVCWIITSEGYGKNVDNKELIKINTALALKDFCDKLFVIYPHDNIINVYSNKFNSGLFNVPWEESELILETVLKRYPKINWIVCDPEMKSN